MIITLCILGWYISGILSFLYWWTKDYDFTTQQILLALFVGLGGPIAFPIGYSIHGSPRSFGTIIKKKRK